ncbi:MAG: hypothetical protein ACM3X3_06390 [Betaproteobacteria bacterium]
MSIDGWVLLIAVAFLLGYIVGHRHGRVEGFRDGAVFAPIEMRRVSLERGRCIICGTGTGTSSGAAAGASSAAAATRPQDGCNVSRKEAMSPGRRSSPERE